VETGKSLNIVFMGTPEFAVATLDALMKSRHKIVAVITVPDKPASRGLKMQASAVKEYALKHNLKILQPEKLKSEAFINELKQLNSDLQVVVAFRMLPEIVWRMPKYGTINLHASLLPQYRGAAPINWAIINGEKETGNTTFLLSHEIDTGDILMQERISIEETDDAGIVHDKLMNEGAKLIVKTVEAIADGTAKPLKQPQVSEIRLAPKIYRETCKIDWNKPVEQIYNFIRGLSPYPGAWTELKNTDGSKIILKVFKSVKQSAVKLDGGKVIATEKNQLFIGCSNGTLEITELQAEGKKRMSAADFLRGIPPENKNWTIL
jgi:methionyl-tRNA formyltransferase